VDKEKFKKHATKYEKISKNILLLCLYFDKYSYVKTHCITPMYNELLFMIKHEKTEKFDFVFKKIEDFYNHHRTKKNSPLTDMLPVLAGVVSELSTLCSVPVDVFCPTMKGGFLLSS